MASEASGPYQPSLHGLRCLIVSADAQILANHTSSDVCSIVPILEGRMFFQILNTHDIDGWLRFPAALKWGNARNSNSVVVVVAVRWLVRSYIGG